MVDALSSARVRRPRFRPDVEQLEDRTVPSTILWVNRGSPTSDTDGYNAAFGANADAARKDTDAAVLAWQNLIVGFNYADAGLNDTYRVTISADPTTLGNGASAGADAFDSAGKPTVGSIGMGVGADGKGGGWFFDPNPADLNANFQGGLLADGGGFVALASPQGPAAQSGDYFSVVAIELAHAFGMGTAANFTSSPLFAKTTNADNVNPPGTLYTFNGPDVRALFTSDNGNTTDTGSPIHVALPDPTNKVTDAQGNTYTGQVDTDNASYNDGRRYLPSQTDALALKDTLGFTVNPNPARFGPGNQALAGTGLAATGPGPGGGNGLVVAVASTGKTVDTIQAYDPSFTGGFETALANDKGTDIAVTAPGPGGGPNVRVFDAHTGALRLSFDAFDPSFTGGVNVAVGDVNGDGVPDIIVAPMAGGGPVVRIFDGNTGQLMRQFIAYDPSFRGGVNLAFARVNIDTNGGDSAWIVTAPGAGGGAVVKVWGAETESLLREFMAYDAAFRGGTYVAAGDTLGDGSVNVVTAPMAGGGPLVRVFDGAAGDGTLLGEFLAYDSSFRGGVRLAVGVDASGDGTGDIITAPGAGAGPDIRIFDGGTFQLVDQYFASDPSSRGGTYVSDLASS